MKNSITLFAAILFFSCATKNSKMHRTEVYWVNSAKIPCEGVAPMHCLQIQKGEKLSSGGWQRFYSNIEGFDFQPGFIYKLSVREEKLDPEEVPADGSSIKYKLLEVLEKKQNVRLRLYDIWALESIGKISFKSAENQVSKHPTLELNTTENRYFGNDGCNNISGKIEQADSINLVFGIGMGTKMACPNMDIPRRFNLALEKVRSYKIADLRLGLFDESGDEVLRLRKVD